MAAFDYRQAQEIRDALSRQGGNNDETDSISTRMG
jgi:hypothetical protein